MYEAGFRGNFFRMTEGVSSYILKLTLSFGFTVPGGGRCFAFSLLAGHLRLGLIMLLRKGGVPGTAHKGERFECI